MTARARRGSTRPATPTRPGTAVRGAPSVLEGFVGFDAEFSILLCRGADGEIVTWDAPRNRHEGGILALDVPAGAGARAAIAEGEALARRVADALGHVGMLAMEFFAVGGAAHVQRDGAARPQ